MLCTIRVEGKYKHTREDGMTSINGLDAYKSAARNPRARWDDMPLPAAPGGIGS
jgi:hypothetical protein